MQGQKVIEAVDHEFDHQVCRSDRPVLIMFYALWCGPSTSTGWTVYRLAEAFTGELETVWMDIDLYPKTATAYGICATPTLTLFRDGRRVSQKIGTLPFRTFYEWLKAELGSSKLALKQEGGD